MPLTAWIALIVLVGFLVWCWIDGRKVVYPEGTWMEYLGPKSTEFYTSPFIRINRNVTKSDTGSSLPRISHHDISPAGKLEYQVFLLLAGYEVITDPGRIAKLEKTFQKKLAKQKADKEAQDTKRRNTAQEKFFND